MSDGFMCEQMKCKHRLQDTLFKSFRRYMYVFSAHLGTKYSRLAIGVRLSVVRRVSSSFCLQNIISYTFFGRGIRCDITRGGSIFSRAASIYIYTVCLVEDRLERMRLNVC